MAVKRKNQKKQESEERMKKAVKIKCCYCDIKTICIARERKEKDELRGIVTLCTFTPNKKSKKTPKKKPKNIGVAKDTKSKVKYK